MSDIKATLTSGSLQAKFQIWQGYLQKPKWEIDKFTRLGGNKIYVQKTRRLSNTSNIRAAFLSNDLAEIITNRDLINDFIGSFVIVNYFGETFNRVLLENASYNIRATSGTKTHIIEWQLELQVEEED